MPEQEGGWTFRDKEFLKAATLSSWAIVVFSNPVRTLFSHRSTSVDLPIAQGRQDAAEPVIQEFVRSLIDGAREVGASVLLTGVSSC